MSAVSQQTLPATLEELHHEAAVRFGELGWPTNRLEEWKYTSLAAVARVPWKQAGDATPSIEGLSLAAHAAAELVFVNGRYAPSLSTVGTLRGVHIANLASTQIDSLPQFGRFARYEQSAMTALNAANVVDGAVIEVIDGVAIEGFIHLLFVSEGEATWSHPRVLIVAGRATQLSIVETYAGNGHYLTNAVTELVAGDGAVIDHCRIIQESAQASHIGTLQIQQERSSNVTSRCITLGGSLVRNDINSVLAGQGASVTLDGLFVVTGNDHADNHTVIDHVLPNCESIELYKGILDGNARGIFDGRIIVRENASKTVSRQTNKNLVLSESAIVDSKPTLEILNDDVKCNHGSTIGQLDEQALFYLKARGIGEQEARDLLVSAFAGELVGRIKFPAVRESVTRTLFARMPQRLPERREKER